MAIKKEEQLSKEDVMEALEAVTDPELGIDLVTLGLIYGVKVDKANEVEIRMTLTTSACPFADLMLKQAKEVVLAIGASNVHIEVVFDPPWKPSEELRAMLGV